jgi:ATP-binding cassette subfamily B protein/ATP-binding cassette subfamily C protein
MTLIITFILLFLALIIINIFFKKTKIQGVKKSEAAKKLNRILEETFGNFKFMKLKGNDKQIIDVYKNSVTVYAQAETISETIGILPKNILENLGFSLIIAAIIYIIWRYDSADKVIPIISMYALALYRILPAVFKILQNINKLVYYQYSLNMVYENINQATEEEGNQDITFGDQINFNDVSFNYVSNHEILKNVSFDIKKGEKIAFSGESGSGKTTLVDLIIGLNKPVSGTIAVDNIIITNKNIRSWRKKIGYIPQNIYLFDGTVAENITFGSDFNQDQLINALKTANIWDFLSQKEGIHTRVGEGGNQLSGGQKQRIGIARALYNNPEILVLDEATSALDYETEEKIMNEIYNISKDKTLIVIAHRISTLKNCNKIININKGIISIDEKIL